ncbi:hypothetical protein F5884DRAFT_757386 [Xylogone sp. PMI_703]|nr:hypothetical protein F5884DRAFT_757386 [Xylogone sp. PMI_703]
MPPKPCDSLEGFVDIDLEQGLPPPPQQLPPAYTSTPNLQIPIQYNNPSEQNSTTITTTNIDAATTMNTPMNTTTTTATNTTTSTTTSTNTNTETNPKTKTKTKKKTRNPTTTCDPFEPNTCCYFLCCFSLALYSVWKCIRDIIVFPFMCCYCWVLLCCYGDKFTDL